jgi:DNA-binding transcriptional LysR family regulator
MTGTQRWASLEIRLISAFVAVVEKGSFAAAARELGYTQSGVSQQVAALERIVDCQLLIRHAGGRRPVQPTAAGKALLEHSRALLEQIERAYDDLNGRLQAPGSTVRVSAFSSIAVRVLPELLRGLHDTRVEILEHWSDDELYEHLDSGAADVAFAVLPAPPRFNVEQLGSDSYVAVVAAGTRLGEQPRVTVADLRGRSLLGITGCAHEELVESRLAAAGLEGPTFERYDDNRLIQSLVAAGHGIAIVPWLTVDHHDPAVSVLPLAVELPPRRIGLIHQRDRLLGPAAREFRTLAVKLCRSVLRQPDATARAV